MVSIKASRLFRAGVISVAVLGLPATVARTASAAASAAFNISATFTTGGITTGVNPVNRLSSGGASRYSKNATFSPYQKTLRLTTDAAPAPVFVVNIAKLQSHISGMFGVDTISAEGDATTTGLNLSLALSPTPAGTPPTLPFLHITANKIRQTGSYNLVAPSFATVNASANIGGLAITGSLLGGKTLKFTGTPGANTVLFKSPTVTITLNHSLTSALISCSPKCVVTPVSIDTSGLEITLTNADLNGRQVTGRIDISAGDAGSELSF